MAAQHSPDPNRKYSIAVVGGGICGLCLAIGLLKEGVSVDIYEAAPAFAEIGAGVSLGPNAAHAMNRIDPAVHQGYLRCATSNGWESRAQDWFCFRHGEVGHAADGGLIHNLWCETGQRSVHRAQFLDELVRLVPSHVAHFGKRLTNIEDVDDNAVQLTFADGTTARHSAVIACDGIKSRARRVVLGDDPATHAHFSGKYAYRGLIPMDQAVELLGDELARNAQMYLGHDGHVLTFPIEHGDTMNVVAFRTKPDGRWDDAEWVKPMDRAAMEHDFDGWVDPVRQILTLMQKPDVWALFHHRPGAASYCKNRVCLLGDAAHASTPHNGAGAGMAIEDALCMSRLLARVYDSADLPRAFVAFDRIRRPRTQRHVEDSYVTGQLYDFHEAGVGADIPKIQERLASKMDWYWHYDLDAEAIEAQSVYEEAGRSS